MDFSKDGWGPSWGRMAEGAGVERRLSAQRSRLGQCGHLKPMQRSRLGRCADSLFLRGSTQGSGFGFLRKKKGPAGEAKTPSPAADSAVLQWKFPGRWVRSGGESEAFFFRWGDLVRGLKSGDLVG